MIIWNYRVDAVSAARQPVRKGDCTKKMQYENFARYLRNNSNGIKSAVIMDTLYAIKDVCGGVDYVRLEEKEMP